MAHSVDAGLTWTEDGTVNSDRGLDHYFAAVDIAEVDHGDRVSPAFPPPDGAQAGFNGDYSGLTIPKGSEAHPIWSDTRNADPYAPQNGVVHDEDVFTDTVGLPNGNAHCCSVGTIGRR